jgi:SAM-dependent MidA family methyltransferase
MELAEIISRKIKTNGPIPFSDFMEMCLYYPGSGYYTSPSNRIGRDGDFYTSSSLLPVMGTLLGRQLEEMWETLEQTPFTIVEYGAGTGALCKDILGYLSHNDKMYRNLRYCIIERSPAMRTMEKNDLAEKVQWCDSIHEIEGFNGCVLSNELVDNFSVHQVVMEKELMEVFVGYDDGFTEVLRPAGVELLGYFEELNIALPENFRTEINLEAINWIGEAAAALNEGYIITIDYGNQSGELYQSCRSNGTLLCYHKHEVNDRLYDHIGSQDITSHVNFSALSHWGAKKGLHECGFTDQCRFLLALGFNECVQEMVSAETNILMAARKATMLKQILLLEMGSKFKVLIQEKGIHPKTLSGLSLASAAPPAFT